jgi:hypothetical protein
MIEQLGPAIETICHCLSTYGGALIAFTNGQSLRICAGVWVKVNGFKRYTHVAASTVFDLF